MILNSLLISRPRKLYRIVAARYGPLPIDESQVRRVLTAYDLGPLRCCRRLAIGPTRSKNSGVNARRFDIVFPPYRQILLELSYLSSFWGSLQTNHIMDYGPRGLPDTLDICRQSGVQTVGAGQNLAKAQMPLLVTIKGVRIAFLAIAEHEFSIATRRSPGAAPVDLADNYRQVNSARQQADLVFVMLHGGNERYPLPSPRLVKVCHFLVDAGSSLVVCNHSHVASGIEIYRDVPIVYGQGNFIFDRDGRPNAWYTGYLLRVKASDAGVASLEAIPYIQSWEEAGIRRMCGKEAEEFLQEFDRLSSIVLDTDALALAWQEFCRTRQNSYLACLLRWGRMKRRLMQSGLEPSRFLRPRRANELLNMFRCESHRDVLVQILTDVAIDPRYGN